MDVTSLRNGVIYKESDQPLQVVKYQHVKVSRGGATVRIRVKNLITGQVFDKSYVASARVEDATVEHKNAQYLYKDTAGYNFMDPQSYEQFNLPADIIGDESKFLREGEKVQVIVFDNKPISIQLPITMVFTISYTEPGFKGNTVTNVYKDATLDNGTKVKVPTFIKIGDKIKVDTRTGEYVSKA